MNGVVQDYLHNFKSESLLTFHSPLRRLCLIKSLAGRFHKDPDLSTSEHRLNISSSIHPQEHHQHPCLQNHPRCHGVSTYLSTALQRQSSFSQSWGYLSGGEDHDGASYNPKTRVRRSWWGSATSSKRNVTKGLAKGNWKSKGEWSFRIQALMRLLKYNPIVGVKSLGACQIRTCCGQSSEGRRVELPANVLPVESPAHG